MTDATVPNARSPAAAADPALARELRELADRRQCYEVLTRYCRALDRLDLEMLKSVYFPDAIDEHGVFTGNAHEFCEFIVTQVAEWFEVATHAICNVHMTYYGDVMCTESYLISYAAVEGGPEKVAGVQGASYLSRIGFDGRASGRHVFLMGGRYVDRLERRDGEWRIARRQVVMDWNENFPSGTVSDEGMFATLTLRGTRSTDDPVYANRP